MLGRVAYHDPYFLAQAGARLFGDDSPARSRAEVMQALVPYARSQLARGVPLARDRAARARALSRLFRRPALPADPVGRGETEATRAPELFARGAGGGGADGFAGLRTAYALRHVVRDVRADDALEIRVARHARARSPASARNSRPTSRRSCRSPDRMPLDAIGDGVAGDACAAPSTMSPTRDRDARHVDRARVRERGRRRLVADDHVGDDGARRLHPHPRRAAPPGRSPRRPTAARG